MKITHFCFCMMLLTISSFIWAARVIPGDMQMAQLKAVAGKQVMLSNKSWGVKRIFTLGLTDNNKTFQMNSNVRIRDDGNRFTTFNRLSQYIGRPVAVRFDRNHNIQEIWILTNNEQLMLTQSHKVNQ